MGVLGSGITGMVAGVGITGDVCGREAGILTGNCTDLFEAVLGTSELIGTSALTSAFSHQLVVCLYSGLGTGDATGERGLYQ